MVTLTDRKQLQNTKINIEMVQKNTKKKHIKIIGVV